jgi:hypothetical protein
VSDKILARSFSSDLILRYLKDDYHMPEPVTLAMLSPGTILGNGAIACCALLLHQLDVEQMYAATARGGKL